MATNDSIKWIKGDTWNMTWFQLEIDNAKTIFSDVSMKWISLETSWFVSAEFWGYEKIKLLVVAIVSYAIGVTVNTLEMPPGDLVDLPDADRW
jgi:hypothetical protein